eukprot:CAMPEP_0170544806 /NCGR_PEP_ID=MMETSP0211-20121228/3431_1 /TAXON_ID=311385 /ORGANISM="Pseudokeronopsis sp., Strain OXSARD2" /LENGTH=113 /DNA_ID=CAMNT_0010848547 /DNA_START=90 /DNA_END=431 /DNA_ORIENTATION=+
MGSDESGIFVELFLDLSCSDCKEEFPKWLEFLQMDWLGATVAEKLKYNYVMLPLPYHHECWIVNKLAPYFVDNCYTTPNNCRYEEYIKVALENQDVTLMATDKSENELTVLWT